MAVNALHREYEEQAEAWQRARDVITSGRGILYDLDGTRSADRRHASSPGKRAL